MPSTSDQSTRRHSNNAQPSPMGAHHSESVSPEAWVPASWEPWRSEPPFGRVKPTADQMREVVEMDYVREDVLAYPRDADNAGHTRLLIIGINPSPWTAAANAPFARPGNRFWRSLSDSAVLPYLVKPSQGLTRADERMLAERGVGIINFVARATTRADQLSNQEVREGGKRTLERIAAIKPHAVGVVGITAFRTAFQQPRAHLGHVPVEQIMDIYEQQGVPLPDPTRSDGGHPAWWLLPSPSGLNAHATPSEHAQRWSEVWAHLHSTSQTHL